MVQALPTLQTAVLSVLKPTAPVKCLWECVHECVCLCVKRTGKLCTSTSISSCTFGVCQRVSRSKRLTSLSPGAASTKSHLKSPVQVLVSYSVFVCVYVCLSLSKAHSLCPLWFSDQCVTPKCGVSQACVWDTWMFSTAICTHKSSHSCHCLNTNQMCHD